MRQITDVEIDAKLSEIDKAFESAKARLLGLEQEVAAGKEELLRLQGDYRTWASLRIGDKEDAAKPSADEVVG
jgi:hypothetical protein